MKWPASTLTLLDGPSSTPSGPKSQKGKRRGTYPLGHGRRGPPLRRAPLGAPPKDELQPAPPTRETTRLSIPSQRIPSVQSFFDNVRGIIYNKSRKFQDTYIIHISYSWNVYC